METPVNKTNTRLERRVSRSEILKNILEGLAFIITAVWAIFTFTVKESPSLAASLISMSSVSIEKSENDQLKVQYLISAKNIGKSIFTIDTLKIFYWKLPISKAQNMKFFNIDKYVNSHNNPPDSAYVFTRTQSLLITEYPSQLNFQQDFTFFMHKASDTAIIFKHVLIGHRRNFLFINCDVKSTGHQWVFGIDTIKANEIDLPSDNDSEEKKE